MFLLSLDIYPVVPTFPGNIVKLVDLEMTTPFINSTKNLLGSSFLQDSSHLCYSVTKTNPLFQGALAQHIFIFTIIFIRIGNFQQGWRWHRPLTFFPPVRAFIQTDCPQKWILWTVGVQSMDLSRGLSGISIYMKTPGFSLTVVLHSFMMVTPLSALESIPDDMHIFTSMDGVANA